MYRGTCQKAGNVIHFFCLVTMFLCGMRRMVRSFRNLAFRRKFSEQREVKGRKSKKRTGGMVLREL